MTQVASPPAARPIAAGQRVAVIDVLRGFALLGILVVNMSAFRGPFFGAERGGPLDQAATWVIGAGFELKFYVLFSFLFGYGLTVQLARAQARGADFTPRYLRRLLGLLLLGVAHALLLYVGDILVVYALLGLVLLAVRRAPDRVLLGLAAGLPALTAVLALAGAVALAVLGGVPGGAVAPEAGAEAVRGTVGEVIAQRAREYPATFAFGLLGQGPTAFGMFCLGLWAGRRRLFERVEDHLPLLRRVLVVGLAVGLAGNIASATARLGGGVDVSATFLAASAVQFATAPFLSAGYVAALTLAFRDPAWRRRLEPLAALGRLALTNYLLQSLVASLIFTGYGLALYGSVGAAAGLLLSVVIWLAQIPLSAWWLRRFRFGPAEWVLRSFTYGRPQPLRADRPA